MRFPLVCLSSAAVAVFALSAEACAQSAPGSNGNAASPTRIDDIQVSREGETVSILVKLSQQPTAASVKSVDDVLTLEVDGVTLTPLTLSPPAGAMLSGVRASPNTITLSGAALEEATTTIYRNAILIEAKYAEPVLKSGTSLMKGAAPYTTQPSTPTSQGVSLPGATQLKIDVSEKSAVDPKPTPAMLTPTTPSAPIALPSPLAKAPQPTHQLQSQPDKTHQTRPVSLPTAAIAGIDPARCTSSAAELAKDAWALGAMGDQALCLLDAGKYDDAKGKLDQLAAITPNDWRVALGHAVLKDHVGETELAKDAWLTALQRAPTESARQAIRSRMNSTAAGPE